MVDYVDMDFINRLSSRLERYRVVNQSPLKINFRCPICGDSKKSKQAFSEIATQNCEVDKIINGMSHDHALNAINWK